jgi:hypothetical protein
MPKKKRHAATTAGAQGGTGRPSATTMSPPGIPKNPPPQMVKKGGAQRAGFCAGAVISIIFSSLLGKRSAYKKFITDFVYSNILFNIFDYFTLLFNFVKITIRIFNTWIKYFAVAHCE